MAAIRLDEPARSTPRLTGSIYPIPLRPVIAALFTAAAAWFVIFSFHWPLLWDGQVMHYINFLMAHGMAPYRDIYDMNMPGAYLVDNFQLHLFGPGDLAWRFYDFFLLGSLITATIVIARPYDWLAGLVAGVLFSLIHGSEGPDNAGQRDEAMTVLLLVGYAFLFQALRRKMPALLLFFGLATGVAISIKPTVAPLALGLGIMALYTLRKRREPLAPYILYAVIGILLPAGVVFGFLQHTHSLRDFLDISTRLTPYYATLPHPTTLELLRRCLPVAIFILIPFGLAAALLNRDWLHWERWALLLGAAFGGFSFFIQKKGYQYHRYTLMAFLILWAALEFTHAIRKRGWSRRVGLAGLLYCTFAVLPFFLYDIYRVVPNDRFTRSLEADLTALGGDTLQHQVQCLDMVDGCLNALYHLKLIQNTGFTGDLLFFAPDEPPAVRYYRTIFWDQIHTSPPKIFILSDEWFNGGRDYSKLQYWPQLAEYLDTSYTLTQTRTVGYQSYRIYIRKN